MTRQVVEYTDLIELFLVLFLLLCFVFFAFLFYFSKKYDEKIELINKNSFAYNENILTGINILLERNENVLSNIENLNKRNESIQKLTLDLKSGYDTTQEYLMFINKFYNKNLEDLVTEIVKLEHLEKENCKLLNILNRKIHNKPKPDNVQ
jgi:predicted PurR-regulated permease PerM